MIKAKIASTTTLALLLISVVSLLGSTPPCSASVNPIFTMSGQFVKPLGDRNSYSFESTSPIFSDPYWSISGNGRRGPVEDVNFDGKIDIRDVAAVANAFGTIPGSPGWNPVYDLNGDSKVDVRDLAMVGRAYGTTNDAYDGSFCWEFFQNGFTMTRTVDSSCLTAMQGKKVEFEYYWKTRGGFTTTTRANDRLNTNTSPVLQETITITPPPGGRVVVSNVALNVTVGYYQVFVQTGGTPTLLSNGQTYYADYTWKACDVDVAGPLDTPVSLLFYTAAKDTMTGVHSKDFTVRYSTSCPEVVAEIICDTTDGYEFTTTSQAYYPSDSGWTSIRVVANMPGYGLSQVRVRARGTGPGKIDFATLALVFCSSSFKDTYQYGTINSGFLLYHLESGIQGPGTNTFAKIEPFVSITANGNQTSGFTPLSVNMKSSLWPNDGTQTAQSGTLQIEASTVSVSNDISWDPDVSFGAYQTAYTGEATAMAIDLGASIALGITLAVVTGGAGTPLSTLIIEGTAGSVAGFALSRWIDSAFTSQAQYHACDSTSNPKDFYVYGSWNNPSTWRDSPLLPPHGFVKSEQSSYVLDWHWYEPSPPLGRGVSVTTQITWGEIVYGTDTVAVGTTTTTASLVWLGP